MLERRGMTWLFSKALMQDYENSRCSQGLVAESSEVTCSDGEPYAQLNVMPGPHKFWHRDKMIDASNLTRFGLTLRLLTESHGTAVLMWFQQAFHVKTYPLPAAALGSMGREADYGEKSPASFAKLAHDSSGWKTHQLSLLGGLEEFSQTWPRWGLMLNGECWELDTSALGIYESESGYLLPTIGKNEYKGSSAKRYRGSKDFRGAKMVEGLRTCSTDPIYLTPSFAEIAMMWPITWTELHVSATDKFQQWQQQHGGFLADEPHQ